METGILIKNIIDQIKEAQIKLGYIKEKMRFYYPLSSVNSMLCTEFDDINKLIYELQRTGEFEKTEIGRLSFSAHEDRLEIGVSSDGVEYVYEKIETPKFFADIINLFATKHNCTIEEICGIFEVYDKNYICKKMPSDSDFDLVVYFSNKKIDEYYYCIKLEMGHTVYHRFMETDYKEFDGMSR